MRSSESERLKPLAWPAYLVAVLLVVIPVTDTVLALVPMRFGDVAWRFGALGMGSQAVMTPLLGTLLILVTAAALGHRTALRVVQVLAYLAAALFVAASILFALDALQTRTSIQKAAKAGFDRASAVALVKYGLAFLSAVVFALTSQRLIRRAKAESAAEAEQPQLVSSSRAGS